MLLLGAACYAGQCGHARAGSIAVIPRTTAQEIWEAEHAGAAHAAQRYGWSVYWNAPSRMEDFPRQVQIVQRAIEEHPDGLVLTPAHDVVLLSAVENALLHKIPTVILGEHLSLAAGNGLSYVLNDDAATGRAAAAYAAQYLHDDDSVLLLGTNPDLLSSMAKSNAFVESLAVIRPHVHVAVKRGTVLSAAAAAEETAHQLSTDAHLRVIVTLNVDLSRASYNVLLNAQVLGHVRLIACDQDLDLLHHLRNDGIDALIAQDTRSMGEQAIENIHRQILGQPVPAITTVPPILITRDNVDSEAVQRVLAMDWRVRP